jgi:hypothetical protein
MNHETGSSSSITRKNKPRTTQRHRLTRLQILRQQCRLIIKIRYPMTSPIRTHHTRSSISLITIASSQTNRLPPRRTIQTRGIIVSHGSKPILTITRRRGSSSRGRDTIRPCSGFALHPIHPVGEIVVDGSEVEVRCTGAAGRGCECCC